MLPQACSAVFSYFIPYNLQEHPYILFTTCGTHSHPPPPPTRTPLDIINELNVVLDQAKRPGITAGQLLSSVENALLTRFSAFYRLMAATSIPSKKGRN